ncbi:MAG TPA: molecular chaperone TorD family protein [Terracidiphilus sp.]|nr:molecular chaperone TorD family protein [Terracidiphilus sp.]
MTTYSAFAVIVDYPKAPIAGLLDDCIAELALEAPDAQAHLLDFQAVVAQQSLSQLQEVYTAAFDLRPDCTPNLGYHLFGDDARRGVFLAELKGRMEAHGMALGVELPDHISFILNYLDVAQEERSAVIEDCLLPAVTQMIEVLKDSCNPYEHALRALLKLLQHQHEILAASAEVVDA